MADLRPADDQTIPGHERLYVRIYPAQDAVVPVGDDTFRPHSGSIRGRDADQPMSIDLGSRSTPEQTRDRGTNGNFHVAELVADDVRELGLRIVRDPIVEDAVPNPAHALILGNRPGPNGDLIGALTKGEYSKLARKARIIRFAINPEMPGAGA
jgi:hypothetical protein